jgi:hypothetical protein
MNLHSRRADLKIITILAFLLIIYNEFGVYYLTTLSWPPLHNVRQSGSANEKPVRFLLVADPQLIGENDEPWEYGWFARWDADRYLRNTFLFAHSHVKPNAIIYLGDLFDEGLKATDEQFERYFQRFKSIYRMDQLTSVHGVKHIYISGDNDVGGEYHGDRNDRLGDRFEKYFAPMVDVITFNSFLEFIKLDLDYTSSFYHRVKRNFLLQLLNRERGETQNSNEPKYTIILNHMSLMFRQEKRRKEELRLVSKILLRNSFHKNSLK